MSAAIPINLETAYPDHRIFMSEDHEPGCARDPWNFELRNVGGRGKVWPYGGSILVAYTDRPGLARALIAIPGATVQQRGEGEVTVQFQPGTESERAVFAVIKPTKRARAGGKPFTPRLVRAEATETTPEPIEAENPADSSGDEKAKP